MRGNAIPFDASRARIRALTGVLTPNLQRRSTNGAQSKEVSASIVRGNRSLQVICPLGDLLSVAQLHLLLNESRDNAQWAPIEQSLRAQTSIDSGVVDAPAQPAIASTGFYFNTGDCGGNGEQLRERPSRTDRSMRVDRARSVPRAMASSGECCGPSDAMRQAETRVAPTASRMVDDCDPPMMATVTFTMAPEYQFLSHDTIICMVFGKCAWDWNASDSWWGEPELWVHFDGLGSGGLFGPGSAPPTPPPVDPNNPVAADTIPNCAAANLDPPRQAWCSANSWPPTAAETAQLDSAINRMRAKGGECAQLASIIESLRNRGRIRIYTDGAHPFSGAAPLVTDGTGGNHWMVLSNSWFTTYNSPSKATAQEPVRRWLDHTLAHEGDHLSGRTHTDSGGFSTPNSSACS